MTKQKIGILTAGGDCPGLNAVIRAVVKTAINEYNYEVIGIRDGFHGIVYNNMFSLDSNAVSGILPLGGTILGTSNRDNPFAMIVKDENNNKEKKDLSNQAIKNLKDAGIDCLVVVGGDGSFALGTKLFKEKKFPVVGVPKTIDNDLGCTDFTFGFNTALERATSAIDMIHTTAEAHHRIMVIEVMGRYAGWIALYSGLAGGGDVILIPEIPFTYESIAKKIKNRVSKNKRFSIIVVAEGAKPKNGELVIDKIVEDSPEAIRLGGIGNQVADKLEKQLDMESRVTVLGHLQRGGDASPYDRILGSRFGTHVVELIKNKNYGSMVALKGDDIITCKMEDAISNLKLVDPNGDVVKTAKRLGTSFGD